MGEWPFALISLAGVCAMRAIIRPVSIGEIEEILPLWQEAMSHHARIIPFFQPAVDGAAAWRRHTAVAMAKGEGALFAAWSDGEAVAFICGLIHSHAPVFAPGRIGYISDLYVRADCRRHGLGRLLFLTLRDWFMIQGADALDLQAYLANAEAKAFWEAMGFTGYAVRMRYEKTGPKL